MITDKLDCGVTAIFAVRREAHPRSELGTFKSLVTVMMDEIYSSETSVLTSTTRWEVPEDI
jgi:hypothetical protein